jgi:formylglycine-generating enzyme required for sulfatase activity
MRAALAACLVLAAAPAAAGESLIPAGVYAPFVRATTPRGAAQPIAAFRLDVEPVTNAEFLAFVTQNPQWRRSRVKHLFADARYLRRWRGDLELGPGAAGNEPATNVSWFAAQAYCRARGERLPTTAQWEYALADAGRDQARVREISLAWFAEPNAERLGPVGRQAANGYGVKDMVGLVWEWTLDFDAYALSADSGFACAGAATDASNPEDYPAFMRFSLRASLKASYTADNLGFRCAGDAP